jgi:hypothetical protein
MRASIVELAGSADRTDAAGAERVTRQRTLKRFFIGRDQSRKSALDQKCFFRFENQTGIFGKGFVLNSRLKNFKGFVGFWWIGFWWILVDSGVAKASG